VKSTADLWNMVLLLLTELVLEVTMVEMVLERREVRGYCSGERKRTERKMNWKKKRKRKRRKKKRRKEEQEKGA